MSSRPTAAPAYRRTNRALFFGGFSCFALLYCVQPLMPLLAHEFALSPAQSSLSLSIATAALALSLLCSSVISDRLGRKNVMVVALVVSATMTVLSAFAHNYAQLLAARALLGLALGGMPAVAMAYLNEEIEPASLGVSMGLLISGNAFGGMLGRMLASFLSDFLSWRVALGAMGVAGLLAAWEFWRSLPPSRNFRTSSGGAAMMLHGLRRHLGDAGLPWLFALSFLLMGCFVSAYNLIGFRLLGAPFGLRQSLVGAISLLYLLGIFSSVWAGRRADRLGRRHVLWTVMGIMLAGLLLTLAQNLIIIVAGMAIFTFGFFASHSIASSWVGRRALTQQALASALYLFFYYLGASVVGWLCGVLWEHAGWGGVVALLGSFLGGALLISLRLRSLAPLADISVARTYAAFDPTRTPNHGR
ncbi:MFS transporter [Massilia sp. LXY-6]|uniref:MFS transporter n=1 Tax=Massilia sp. LXY-6 TaxID=3379823 RepID=UPI003EDFFFF8